MTARLIGYARVSTDLQDTAAQETALKAAGCALIFTEYASGARDNRTQLKAALDALQPGDTLVVWKLDRLARRARLVYELAENLAEQGKKFRSLTEAVDTTTPAGWAILGMLATFAQFERAVLIERIHATLKERRAAGDRGELSKTGKKLAGRAGPVPKVSAQAAAEIRDTLRRANRGTRERRLIAQDLAERHGVKIQTVYTYGRG